MYSKDKIYPKLPGGRVDYTNETFGRLTALYPIKKGNKKYYWHCKCECGNECDIMTSSLTGGRTISCGCYRKEVCHEKVIDITGHRFGKLVAIRQIPKEEHDDNTQEAVWECRCDCGKITQFRSSDLRGQKVISCGCIKSKGEFKIANLLKENNIEYIQHYTCSDCLYHEKENERGAEFDFYIHYNNEWYLIEYDGLQHFTDKSEAGWNNKANLTNTQRHDEKKNQYCKEKNISLIRIPYTEYDNLSLKELLLETSKFIYYKAVKNGAN